jgi:hypothetical protein
MEAGLGQRGFQAYDPVYEGNNAQIFRKGLVDPDSISDDDEFVFDLLMHRQFGTMIEVARQIENGIVERDAGIVIGFREHYEAAFLRHPGARRWLSRRAATASVEQDSFQTRMSIFAAGILKTSNQ